MERVSSVAGHNCEISIEEVPPEVWRCSLFTRWYTRIVYTDDKSSYTINTRYNGRVVSPVLLAADDKSSYTINTRPLLLWLPGVIPFILFYIWFLGILSELTANAIIDLIFASGWMLISPYLMARTEYRLAGLLHEFANDDKKSCSNQDGWNTKKYINKLPKMNGLYWIITGLTALIFLCSFLIFDDFIASVLEINSITTPMLTIGAICMFITGFATGNGIWGLLKACKLYYNINRYSKINWYPFRVKQISGLEKLSKDGFITAIVFSTGAFFAPISLRIYFETESNLKYIALIGVILLISGSAILFTLITIIIYRLGKFSRENVLGVVADQIEYYLLGFSMEFMSEKTTSGKTTCGDLEKPKIEFRDLLLLQNSVYSAETHSTIISYLKNLSLVILIPISLAFFPQLLDLFF